VGLSSAFRERIFCSATTKALILHRFPGIVPTKVHALQPGEAYVISLVDAAQPIVRVEQQYEKTTALHHMIVRVIDSSDHCPGAVMFCFDGYFGRYLHTGDFRFTPKLVCRERMHQTHCLLRRV